MLSFITITHVAISLMGIASGFVIVYALLTGQSMKTWHAGFLVTTVATSLTGFLFPFHQLLPSHIVAIISLVLLSVALAARYQFRMSGMWSRVYAVTAVLAFYLNFFVLIAQSFQKVPALRALAPTQSEPAFVATQGAALVVFLTLTVMTAMRSRPAMQPA